MKKQILILLIWIFFVGSALAAGKEITFVVKGMVCSFCAQGIEKKFNTNASIEKVKIDLEKKQITLTLKDGKKLSDEEIKKIVSDAGYKVEDNIVRN